ncbi:hypothetical protein BVC80_1143g10 [Macleaya cordata]|uniref:RNase H type-1 domain-containing protein n=1 Tax=Macleaya cordata TaxID=56857 RepID=A0A200QWF6_MACCD|nr:hypothetical protein BVC80_1143g10 [Macleaya cordata]
MKVFSNFSITFVEPVHSRMLVEDDPATRRPHWLPPAQNFIQINVDGAVGQSHLASAAVARNSNGVFEGYGTQCTSLCSPIEAEALAFLLGIKLALKMNFFDCVIEGDVINIIHFINDNSLNIPWKIRAIILDIRSLVSSFHSIGFVHITRACNKAAHNLAKFALNSSFITQKDSVSLKETVLDLAKFVDKGVQGNRLLSNNPSEDIGVVINLHIKAINA